MFQRLPVAPAEVKADITSDNILNHIRQYFLLCIEQ